MLTKKMRRCFLCRSIERPFDETEGDEKDGKGAKKAAKKTSFRRKPTPFWRDR